MLAKKNRERRHNPSSGGFRTRDLCCCEDSENPFFTTKLTTGNEKKCPNIDLKETNLRKQRIWAAGMEIVRRCTADPFIVDPYIHGWFMFGSWLVHGWFMVWLVFIPGIS